MVEEVVIIKRKEIRQDVSRVYLIVGEDPESRVGIQSSHRGEYVMDKIIVIVSYYRVFLGSSDDRLPGK